MAIGYKPDASGQMQDFRNLRVWQKAHELALSVYDLTVSFPRDERFGLVSQLRRAAVSIPSNIAEGTGRQTDGQLWHFLNLALGSATEVEYQLLLSKDLKFLSNEQHVEINNSVNEVKRMLAAFIRTLKPYESHDQPS